MSEYRRVTRADKHTKRRTNNRKILFFVGLAVVCVIVLFSLFIFGDDDDTVKENEAKPEKIATDEDAPKNEVADTTSSDDEQVSGEQDVEQDIENIKEIDDVDDIVIQHIESTDENVIEAYTGNWPPIETVQEEPHTTNYDEGSDDREEIKRAASLVTGIKEENIVEHWVGNDGEQKVIATVSEKNTDEYYNVYVTWVEDEGWQVSKVERIKRVKQAD